jgi:hypothetical protein
MEWLILTFLCTAARTMCPTVSRPKTTAAKTAAGKDGSKL